MQLFFLWIKGTIVAPSNSYVPGGAYKDFLKEKNKESFISFIRNIERLLGVKHNFKKQDL
ncbi:hypothetical protein C1N73_27925 (plasmid) [Priestia aryabhattai]